MLNPMQQAPLMQHQMAPLHHQHQGSHVVGPVDQRGVMMQKHMQQMAAAAAAGAGTPDMVDWRHGQSTGGNGDNVQQYRHTGQTGPYPGPVLHHSQQHAQQVRRQAGGFPPGAGGGGGPVYPGISEPAGYGLKVATSQYGGGAEYGRPLPNGFMASETEMSQASSSAHQMGGMRPMTSLPAGAKCQAPGQQQQQLSGSAMSNYQQQYMPSSSYGHQPMSRPVSEVAASGPTLASASQQHQQQLLHERLTATDVCSAPNPTGNSRKSKDKMANADNGHQQQQRMVPYPTPQQYMQNKRAKYSSGGATSPEVPYNASNAVRFDPSSVGPYSGAPRPLRHLGPTSPEYIAGPRQMTPYPSGAPGGPPSVGPSSAPSYPHSSSNVYDSSHPPSRSPGMAYSGGPRSNYQLSPLPGNPTPPMTPGLCNGGSGVYYQQSPVNADQKHGPDSSTTSQGPVVSSRGIDNSSEGVEPRLAFVVREGLILAPFRLEHNLAISNLVFVMRGSVYQHVMSRPDLDVQLKCFHHEDQLMKTNWPASVSVSVNSIPLGIDRGDGRNMRPVFLKRVIQPGHNMLQIAVTNCCCSHLFVIQLVHRPTVRSAINGVLSQRLVMADQSVTKIKRSLGQRSMMSGGMHDDLMKISLVCAMSHHRISLPARGIDCTHVQCFDLETYLRINTECNAWLCPICNKPAIFDGLEVDQFVWGILQHLVGTQFMEVAVDQTASWKPVAMNGMMSPDNGGNQWLKPVNPESMMLPTVHTWLSQISGGTRVQSPASFGGTAGNQTGGSSSRSHYAPGAGGSSSVGSPWCPPPSVSTSVGSPPDYIGCLSQMSNTFLSAADEQQQQQQSISQQPGTVAPTSSQQHVMPTNSGPPTSMSRQHSEHGSGASLPPTPVGSQLSGSQICTPLDGQSLHPRTPSDTAASNPSSFTPGATPLDGSSSSSSQRSPTATSGTARQRESSVSALEGGDVIDPADQDALDMLPDNLDDPMELLTYLGPNGGHSIGDGGLDCSDNDILSMFSC